MCNNQQKLIISTKTDTPLLAVIMYGQLLTKPIKKLSSSMPSIENSLSSIKRIFAIIDYQNDK